MAHSRAVAHLLHDEAQDEVYERGMRRERVFRDRTDPLADYDDYELYRRFRFDRQSIVALAELLEPSLQSTTNRSHAIGTVHQVSLLSAIDRTFLFLLIDHLII